MSRAHSHSTLPQYTCCRGAGSLPFANYISPHLASCSAWGGVKENSSKEEGRVSPQSCAARPAPPAGRGKQDPLPRAMWLVSQGQR